MKRNLIAALAVSVCLGGCASTAGGDRAAIATKPVTAQVTAQVTAEQVRADVVLSTKAHAGGYGNPNLAFFFVLAYVFAVPLLS